MAWSGAKIALVRDIMVHFRVHRPPVPTGAILSQEFFCSRWMPALVECSGFDRHTLALLSRVDRRESVEELGFARSSHDLHDVVDDPAIRAVFLCVPPAVQSPLIAECWRAGKILFSANLALEGSADLEALIRAWRMHAGQLMAASPLRFSSQGQQLREALAQESPLVINSRRSTELPVQPQSDSYAGSGQGESSEKFWQLIDFVLFLASSLPVRIHAEGFTTAHGLEESSSQLGIVVKFADESLATLSYQEAPFAVAPQDRVEVWGRQLVAALKDFRELSIRSSGNSGKRFSGSDSGCGRALEAFVKAVRAETELPVSFSDYVLTVLTAFCVKESLATGAPRTLDRTKWLPVTAPARAASQH